MMPQSPFAQLLIYENVRPPRLLDRFHFSSSAPQLWSADSVKGRRLFSLWTLGTLHDEGIEELGAVFLDPCFAHTVNVAQHFLRGDVWFHDFYKLVVREQCIRGNAFAVE